MIRSLVIFLILIMVAVVGLLFVPLGTALKFSGIGDSGVTWNKAAGSILSGRVEGLNIKGTEYGDADVDLDSAALVKGRLQYGVTWTGKQGQGTGKVSVQSGPTMELRDYAFELNLLEYEKAAKWLRNSGGTVKLEGSVIRFRGSECLEAVGAATSDVLDRNRDLLGSGWSSLSGTLTCDAGQLLIPLGSENPSGTRFAAQLRVAPGAPGQFEASLGGRISPALEFALPLAGFIKKGDAFVYAPAAKAEPAPAPTAETEAAPVP